MRDLLLMLDAQGLRPALSVGALVVVLALLFWLLMRRRRTAGVAAAPATPPAATTTERVPARPASSAAGRLRSGLAKTRHGLAERLAPLLARRQLGDRETEDLEVALLGADVGVQTTDRLLTGLRSGRDGDAPVRERLSAAIRSILEAPGPGPRTPTTKPWVVMVVGVNGVGKTTTIGKLAAAHTAAGRRVLLVAADTFRAAAIEQLAVWADRVGAELVRQQQGSDPGAVVYDGIHAARARNADVVIVDTAGRLHTKTNLMEELRKVRRIIARESGDGPHETLLVLDAVTGQNGLAQARAFVSTLGVDGVILTKLDGTAKGGIVVAIAGELGLPIRYVGIGEGLDDLRAFDARQFAAALLGDETDVSLDT